jgi:O-antigen ligase
VAARQVAAPAYLALCLLLGGSATPAWPQLALQLAGLAIIVWALAVRREQPNLAVEERSLLLLMALAVGLVLVQLVPLPPAIWALLPGRGTVAEGYRLLGMPLPWLPLSLSPHATQGALLSFVPPVAIFAAARWLGPDKPGWSGLILLGVALAGVLVGIAQVSSGGPDFHAVRNDGAALGFFANSNHQGLLLVAAIPFLAVVGGRIAGERPHRRGPLLTLLALAAGLSVVGIVLSGSLAAAGLLIPVAAASALLMRPQWRRRWRVVIAAALLVPAIAAPLTSQLSTSGQVSLSTRAAIAQHTALMIRDTFPFGIGAGAFAAYYPRYEDATEVDRWYVNHAHNDYLEIAAETGLGGTLLVLTLLWWWGRRSIALWRSPASSAAALAGTVASAALLLHSLVDYPLRTDALAALLGYCLAAMRLTRGPDASGGPRHLGIGGADLSAREQVPHLPPELAEGKARARAQQELAQVNARRAERPGGGLAFGQQLALRGQHQAAGGDIVLDLVGQGTGEEAMGQDQGLVDGAARSELDGLGPQGRDGGRRQRVQQRREVRQPFQAEPGTRGAVHRKVGDLLRQAQRGEDDVRRDLHQVRRAHGLDARQKVAVVGHARVKVDREVLAAPDALLSPAVPVRRVDRRLRDFLFEAERRQQLGRPADRRFGNQDVEVSAGLQKRITPGHAADDHAFEEQHGHPRGLEAAVEPLRLDRHAEALAGDAPEVGLERLSDFFGKAGAGVPDGLPDQALHPVPAGQGQQPVAIRSGERLGQGGAIQCAVAIAATEKQKAESRGHGRPLSGTQASRPC